MKLYIGVKERREEMENVVRKAGKNGMEVKELIKLFADRWGFRVKTVKGYISDLVELEKVRIADSRIYHSMFRIVKKVWPPP